jgi:hypothetical protein
MKIITAVLLVTVLNANCLIHQHVSGQSIRISDVMKEHEAMLALNLWPGFALNEIPVAVYDSTNTYLFFSEKAPEGFLAVESTPGIFIFNGQYHQVRGNSIVQIDGIWTATSVLTAYSRRTLEKYSPKDLAGIIVHEQFHIFQRINHPSWRQNDGVLLFYPPETNESLFLRRLEKEAFKQAVTSEVSADIAGWAALGLKYRQERFQLLVPVFIDYERVLQLTEGLSEYIEKTARGADPLNASDITNGIAPAGVRDLGYVEGRWIAMILDRLDTSWKSALEKSDTLYLEEILEIAIAKIPYDTKNFSGSEMKRTKEDAESDFTEWQTKKEEEINTCIHSPGYSVEILSQQNPLTIRMFDPLETENLTDGGVFNRVFFSAFNQHGSLRIVNHPCIIHFDDSFRLVRTDIFGIPQAPVIHQEEKKFILTFENSTIELNYAEIQTEGTKYIITI